MNMKQYQLPEGALLEAARLRLKISQNEAGRRAEMSGTRWRQIVNGYRQAGTVKITAEAPTLARMAQVVELHIEDFGSVRPDVVEVLRTAIPTLRSSLSLFYVNLLLRNIRVLTTRTIWIEALALAQRELW